jgi:hypothetical protein
MYEGAIGSGLSRLSCDRSPWCAPRAGLPPQHFYFYPFTVGVRVVASVEWTNYDPVGRTATSDAGFWDSCQLTPAAVRRGSGGSYLG